jgi:CheY-like chemotaxis protein
MSLLKCIMLIDDDEISHFLTARTILTEGLADRVETALNGEEGLQKLNVLYNGDNEYPEVILLDIKMPVLDGFGFLKKFNELDLVFRPQVVMLSSSINPSDLSKAKEYNIKGFLNKPLSAAEFRHLIGADF